MPPPQPAGRRRYVGDDKLFCGMMNFLRGLIPSMRPLYFFILTSELFIPHPFATTAKRGGHPPTR